jgi:hypothetical protein
MSEEPYTVCRCCDERVEPDAPGVVYAVERHEVLSFWTMGPTRTIVDGMGGFFHPGCSPEAVGCERRQRPTSAA